MKKSDDLKPSKTTMKFKGQKLRQHWYWLKVMMQGQTTPDRKLEVKIKAANDCSLAACTR